MGVRPRDCGTHRREPWGPREDPCLLGEHGDGDRDWRARPYKQFSVAYCRDAAHDVPRRSGSAVKVWLSVVHGRDCHPMDARRH